MQSLEIFLTREKSFISDFWQGSDYTCAESSVLRSIQPRPQSNFKKVALAPLDYAENFYLIWFVNCKTIKINLCNAVNFP